MTLGAILYFGFQVGLMLTPLNAVRRRNGVAVLWDTHTKTQVIDLPQGVVRATVDVETPVVAPAKSAEVIGPYAVSAGSRLNV
ncbi:MAG: hypothetical protein CMJ59_12465 [Planctomycetaceae bacterium]|nr:hypothetical protein [Planctomycetaceae bacterium]